MASEMKLLPDFEEFELIELWGGRTLFSEKEWERLYLLVMKVIMQFRHGKIRALAAIGDHADLAQSFFLAKVFEPKNFHSKLHSAKALATFFDRYLIDLMRENKISLNSSGSDHEFLLDSGQETEGSESGRPTDTGKFDSKQASCGCPVYGDTSGHNLDSLALHKKAGAFYRGLQFSDQIYLLLNTCADDPQPFSELATRFNIASWHYRIGKLGIPVRKKNPERSKIEQQAVYTHPDYQKTTLGRWMSSELGVQFSPLDFREIGSIFLALCNVADAMASEILACEVMQ